MASSYNGYLPTGEVTIKGEIGHLILGKEVLLIDDNHGVLK